ATTEQVAGIVALCASSEIPIVPQGGNTGLVGGATPDASGKAVVVSMSRLSRVCGFDPENNTVTVQAGCVLQTLQEYCRDRDRLFPLSLAAEGSCTIGWQSCQQCRRIAGVAVRHNTRTDAGSRSRHR
ncbi:FAD-binding oxidoreductase, partial [Mesorhizobium calcicola]